MKLILINTNRNLSTNYLTCYSHNKHTPFLHALASAPELILPSDSSVALDAQVRFCERQLENVKTRRALERAFGVDLTDRYMRQVLFDVTPSTPRRPS